MICSILHIANVGTVFCFHLNIPENISVYKFTVKQCRMFIIVALFKTSNKTAASLGN